MTRRWTTADARARHHVPATSTQDSRYWVCGRCGRSFLKVKAAWTAATPGYIPWWDKKCPHCGEKQP